jgi:hypothetical protein
VLFSSSEVADYVNATFEPAWESVRPAPLVTIDFGNGQTVKRTLQGNIATYVCSPGGIVYDVLPGIYTPAVYRRELETCRALAQALSQPSRGRRTATGADPTQTGDELSARLREYHARQATRLDAKPAPTPRMQTVALTGGGFKMGGGIPLPPQGVRGGSTGGFQGGLGGGGLSGGVGGIEGPTAGVIMGRTSAPAAGVAKPTGPLAARPELALDAQVNELIRRRAIHERLARLGAVHPDDIKKWLFKEVLHADLDDPQLGLGRVLNDNYPFADEDRAAAERKPVGQSMDDRVVTLTPAPTSPENPPPDPSKDLPPGPKPPDPLTNPSAVPNPSPEQPPDTLPSPSAIRNPSSEQPPDTLGTLPGKKLTDEGSASTSSGGKKMLGLVLLGLAIALLVAGVVLFLVFRRNGKTREAHPARKRAKKQPAHSS